LAFSHHNVGLSLVAAGDLASALAHFQQELNLFEKLSAADRKDVQGRRNRSLAHKQIGDVLMRTRDFRGALAQYHSALQIDRDLSSVDPGNLQAVLDLSFSEGKVGSALGKLGQTKEALAILQSGVARQEFLIAKDPSHILLYNHLANTYTLVANCLLDSSQRKPAVEYYRKAVAARLTLSQKSPASGANRGALAECYANLARALAPGDPADALKQYDHAAELLENLVVSDASNSQPRIALADALSNAGKLYVRMAAPTGESSTRIRNWTKARSLYQRSQQLWSELGKADKIPHGRADALREVSSELVLCDDSLAKLQGPSPIR
jgi:tetratricopeptide (TPR) repeat protein